MAHGRPNVTNTLWRKFHHSTVVDMTRTERSVEHLLQTIDAHSVHVARTHYILKDPQVDANLAKEVLKCTIGDWPPAPRALLAVPGERR